MIRYIISVIIGYLFGCIQTSYFIGKIIKKTDIRSLGNGNAGASNATKVFGWKYGIIVALIDIIKPIASIILIHYLWNNILAADELIFLKFLNGLGVILGHNYPFFMKFKGGKGTASLIGMLIAIDIKIAIIGIVLIVLTTIITDYIALGTTLVYLCNYAIILNIRFIVF